MDARTEPQSGEAPPLTKSRRIWLAVAYVLGWAATAIAFVAMAPSLGMSSVGGLICVGFSAGTLLTLVGTALCGATLRQGVLIAIATFVGVGVLFQGEAAALIAYSTAHPPPRPVFHNDFCSHETALMPSWFAFPFCDAFGQRAWTDDGDNSIALELTWTREPVFGMGGALFSVEREGKRTQVPFERANDRLLVIRADGRSDLFALRPDRVKGLGHSIRTIGDAGGEPNLAAEVRRLIDGAGEQDRFDAFLRDDRERAPD